MLGAGAALYFVSAVEPSPLLGLCAGAVALAAATASFLRGTGRMALALIAALALGFAAAKAREEMVGAPVLNQTLTLHLTARLLSADPAARGVRLVVGDLRSGGFSNTVPGAARILVSTRDAKNFRAGDGVSLTARLMPPPGPSEPGDSDFGRDAFFQGIGAVGFSYGAPIPAPLSSVPGPFQQLAAAIENLRQTMTTHIRTALPGSEGAIASALITGERGGIDEEDQAALRDAGLAHVLAIAGLHMALVGMGLFWLVRAVLAAFPTIALNYPIKKWTAGAALLGAGFYLIISGASASATRAFVMLAMMLIAILLDRPGLSMRNLALAAAILLLAWPESIISPGFQMSFAAVAGLIAVAEWEQARQRHAPHGLIYRYLRGIGLTSLVGSLATMPFALFTFGRAGYYAVLGNLLAMPVMGFWVMPAAALSVAAMPFGWEAAPLHLLGWGIDVMLAMGRFVSGLPEAVSLARAFPVGVLATMALGGLWLAISARHSLGSPVAGARYPGGGGRCDRRAAGQRRTPLFPAAAQRCFLSVALAGARRGCARFSHCCRHRALRQPELCDPSAGRDYRPAFPPRSRGGRLRPRRDPDQRRAGFKMRRTETGSGFKNHRARWRLCDHRRCRVQCASVARRKTMESIIIINPPWPGLTRPSIAQRL